MENSIDDHLAEVRDMIDRGLGVEDICNRLNLNIGKSRRRLLTMMEARARK